MGKYKGITKHVRTVIMKRDGYKCKDCGTTEYLTVDHIVQISNGGTNDFTNLITLCKVCHKKKDNPTNLRGGIKVDAEKIREYLYQAEQQKAELENQATKIDADITALVKEQHRQQKRISRIDIRIHDLKMRLRAMTMSTERVYVEYPKAK